MPEPLDMHAEGFDQPDDPHPIANLKPLPAGEDVTKAYAEAAAAGLSVEAREARCGPKVTGTLPAIQGCVSGDASLLEIMNDGPAVITLADCTVTGRLIVSVTGDGTVDLDGREAFLSQLPEASPDAEIARLKRERDEARRKAENLESQLAILTKVDQ